MINIIFLDLDGVLNINAGKNATYLNSLNHFEFNLIDRFNFLLDNLDCYLVMSSSWREDYPDSLKQLERAGFKHIDKFIGKTIFDPNRALFRGEEISLWIENHMSNIKYLCVDDDIEQIYNVEGSKIPFENCIKINPEVGLSEIDIKRIIEHFE